MSPSIFHNCLKKSRHLLTRQNTKNTPNQGRPAPVQATYPLHQRTTRLQIQAPPQTLRPHKHRKIQHCKAHQAETTDHRRRDPVTEPPPTLTPIHASEIHARSHSKPTTPVFNCSKSHTRPLFHVSVLNSAYIISLSSHDNSTHFIQYVVTSKLLNYIYMSHCKDTMYSWPTMHSIYNETIIVI